MRALASGADTAIVPHCGGARYPDGSMQSLPPTSMTAFVRDGSAPDDLDVAILGCSLRRRAGIP
jgi:hypothetical protein